MYDLMVQTPGGLHVETVGTNMAEYAMMALWFAAYAVAGKPQSLRVRKGWISPEPSSPPQASLRSWPVSPWDAQKVAGLKALIACKDRDQTWIQLNEETIRVGLHQHPITDPMLKTLVLLYLNLHPENAPYQIDPMAVKQIAPVLRDLLPHLEHSPWCAKMTRISALFTLAAENTLPINAG